MQDHLERELKYDVPDGWVLPDAARVAPDGASVQVESIRMHTVYYDTAERDLLRHGVTLRRRTGDADTGWHLKVPAGDARTELRLPEAGETVPDEFRALVHALVDGETLDLVASLDIERTINRLVAPDATVLAEIADDKVTAVATGDAAIIQSWREVEVELGDADERLLRRSARWLADAGAVPSRAGSKLARAVGSPGAADRAPDGSLAGVVQSHLRQQHRALVRGDIELRRGGDVVHPTRVATRRLRSALRVFDLFDPERAAHLDAELKWYAGVLGEVRDLQVLRGHLLDRAAALPADVSNHTATYLRTRLADDERTKLAELLEVLDGDRYRSLLREVRAFVEQAPRGRKRSAKKVRRYVQQARRKAVKRVASAARLPDDDASTHQARKAAKRGRYTAELAVPTLGKQAERIADEQRRVQNKLGHLQDAVVAAGHIERITPRAAGRSGFGLGLLWSGEQDRADKTRRSLPNLAKRLAG